MTPIHSGPRNRRRQCQAAPRRPHPYRGWLLALVPMVLLLLASCGGTASARDPVARTTPTSAANQARATTTPSPTASPSATARATPSATPTRSAPAATAPKTSVDLTVRTELEPNNYAHRNYCAEGAIAVLLSAWTTAVPSLDAIGLVAHVVESYGTTGAEAVHAINQYLQQITGTSRYDYSGTHVTSLAVFESQLETDLSGLGRFAPAGHGSPVLVHVMTSTLPGWGGYQAQHMIAVFGYDFAAGNPAGDTVTYAESAGSVAGYNGPHVETISLAALWAAMQNYNRDITSDPVTVIS